MKSRLQVKVIRPLLDLPKSVLREYALAHKIPFREDASNASPDFLRNRIRHELLPLLRRKYQPALDRGRLVLDRLLEEGCRLLKPSQALITHTKVLVKQGISEILPQ